LRYVVSGFVRREGASRAYLPGRALTGIAVSILERFEVRDTLRSHLESLQTELGETVHLGAIVRFIDSIDGPRAVRVASRVGQPWPAHCTSTGKVMLLMLSPAEIHRIYPDEAHARGSLRRA
jgi:DNA-binding IclR family transcriptional regulator